MKLDLKKLVLDKERDPADLGAHSAYTLKWDGECYLQAWTYSIELKSHFVLLAQGFDNQRIYTFDDAYDLFEEDSVNESLHAEALRMAKERIRILRRTRKWEVALKDRTEYASERSN